MFVYFFSTAPIGVTGYFGANIFVDKNCNKIIGDYDLHNEYTVIGPVGAFTFPNYSRPFRITMCNTRHLFDRHLEINNTIGTAEHEL
jgi:hypothetical protein